MEGADRRDLLARWRISGAEVDWCIAIASRLAPTGVCERTAMAVGQMLDGARPQKKALQSKTFFPTWGKRGPLLPHLNNI
jgi:hypothetical protein